jgi:pimeloyl-ACP methyl ester carboxylesterase
MTGTQPARLVKQYPIGVDHRHTRVIEMDGGGPPVVFLHGVGARADRWRSNLASFADAGFRTYAVDFPGHGLAIKGDAGAPYTVAGYADFVEQFLEVMSIDKPILIGTSLGGHVASEIACRGATALAALVLVGPMGVLPVGEAAREELADNLLDRTAVGVKTKLCRLLYDDALATDDWVDEEVRINNSPGATESFEALAAYFRDQIDNDVTGPILASLPSRPPVQLVWGTADLMVPTELASRAQQVLGADVPLLLLNDAGHAPYLEQPAAFANGVLPFLTTATALTLPTRTPERIPT